MYKLATARFCEDSFESIREKRLSNFLLWHSAYAELSFIDVKWPDFTTEELIKQIEIFKKRVRKYGDL